jgi:hypothetical protein
MAVIRRNRTTLLAAVVLSVALGVVNASGVGPALLARLDVPLGGSVTEAGLVGDNRTAGDAGGVQEAATGRSVETARPQETGITLEEARARWFELIYEGRNFDAGPAWQSARHPEP